MTITFDPRTNMYTAIIRWNNGHTELRQIGKSEHVDGATLTAFVRDAIEVAME